ncbi:DNA mismatch repair protein MutS [Paenibacillus xerothermodurans]|uniref:DNA mismatch repair protein MutS n=1 Tax=Paenibacillus xerothermodurans TaxID=1977292 RepID=A0A2W1P410_PAEXE|nr:DNA mismatch repair protein MutS [Paenibacillus xerothermodurans]PZE21858.1 DNA mismatch repair protein MutS [Paenibacillus xerothermodurans]
MATYTPMIEQYLAIKAEVQDAFLFFRLGDFYELFFDDAIQAAKELEITLTGRGGGADERIPMCGVPHHSADNYITRLVEKGFKVAICEQVEDPSAAKGVVKREVVRIVTPGTVMDERSLGEKNNYIVSVVEATDGSFGFAACDISTGELFVTRLDGTLTLVIDEMNVYHPSELVAAPELLQRVREYASGWAASIVMTPRAGEDGTAPLTLREYFSDDELAALPAGAEACLRQLMAYLIETQKRSLGHITHVRVYEQKQYMIMDPFTRRNLELVETVRDRAKKGSLLWLLDRTVTAMGGRLLRRWIEKPLMSAGAIEERLEAVDRLYHQLIIRDELRQSLKEVYDLERLVARIAYGSANARDLVALKSSLQQVPALKQVCEASGSTTLQQLAARMDACQDVMAWIEDAIVDEPPVSVRDGGMIKAGYHAYLDQLREADTSGKQWIAELERQERERTGVKSLKIGYNKVFGYYIEVTKANLSSLEPGRYERKQTLANAERFVTPELKEKEGLILEAQEKMVDLEYELFIQLRDRLSSHILRLQQLAEQIASVDVYQSLASVSAANRYSRPQIGDFFELHIEEGRHPVVEAVMADSAFTANETRLSPQDGSMMLITGPNMAGKSTYMRQVAIICLMAQIGCFVPAAKACVPILDRIFTRIGAADDLIGGQSTFMVEMMDIQVMTEKATSKSLVIIDELGRGTSTGEGMAIAQAVIEYLHDEVGCKTLVSTHFHELAHLEQTLGSLRNYCMAVKESGRQVTFLRKLVPGAASTSYGIYCAQIAGLPADIIDRSYELLTAFEARAERIAEERSTAGQLDAQSNRTASHQDTSANMQSSLPRADWLGQERPASAQPDIAPDHAALHPDEVTNMQSSPAGALVSANTPDSLDRVAESLAEAAEQSTGLGLHKRSSEPPPEQVKEDAVVQLSFFQEKEPVAARPNKKEDSRSEKLLEQLKAADLMNMTPMMAMNFLFDLKKQLS